MACTTDDSWQLVKCVCVGPTMQVWQGVEVANDKIVAIKMPLDELKHDRKVLKALKREFEVSCTLKHPKIVKIYELVRRKNETWLIMEWVSGQPLAEVLSTGLDAYMCRVKPLVQNLVETLAVFSAADWVHRSLSPEAFMVNLETNETRLVEFPFARRCHHFWDRFIRTDEVPLHGRSLSPEQIRGEALDPRSDIYSLACILFEITTGIPPYDGESFNQLVHQHLNVPVPVADAVNPNLTPEFTKLLRRCMAKSPTERPATMGDVAKELKEMKIFKK